MIQAKPANNTRLIVVIPCYHEPGILEALQSLFNCSSPQCHVEVLVVVNHAENEAQDIKAYNKLSAERISSWIKIHQKAGITFHLIQAFDLPKKIAGVGLARKIGMDEAVRRFDTIGMSKGIVACFDADCSCDTDYLESINSFYAHHPETNAAIVHFEHPLEGEFDPKVYEGIMNYELHLRYYKNALKYAGFPFHFHTIGSCMTVSAETYQRQGGMNKRKAGEDFYFLQKVFPLGDCHNITSTTVYPSPRPSHRVPFGTGKAIEKFLQDPQTGSLTYHPACFEDLKCFVEAIPELLQKPPETTLASLPESVFTFLKTIDFETALDKIKKNSSTAASFEKSFFQKFNGFTALKFIHFARDNYYAEMEILDAVNYLLAKLSNNPQHLTDKLTALEQLRIYDQSC